MDEKKVNWLVKNFSELVGLFDTKTRASIMVLLFALIGFLGYDLRRVYNVRAVDSEARLKRSEDFIYNQVLRRLEPEISQMRENTDSARAKVDTMAQKTAPLLEKLSEAVEDLNKKRR
ncbi:MAG TPA: hypothetical protein VNQ80_15450 [Parapedobacter sp.]|uniref:hypothetical protein n=1 Tax=Parapedobacter sp. TaxID=1958893 RepID=UPI002CAABCAD|nr:hypothetical protein [Parapedobacter sp.]HWK58738.1 hypothetical protein [Parapedobacter sp.]